MAEKPTGKTANVTNIVRCEVRSNIISSEIKHALRKGRTAGLLGFPQRHGRGKLTESGKTW